MKNLIFAILFAAISSAALAADDCEKPPCKIPVDHSGTALLVGETAAAGLFAAPFGLESALTSMGIAGGLSLLTSAITNNDQKMYVRLQNRAAKAVEKKKTDKPFKNVREGNYKATYGSCKDTPENFQLTKAPEDMAAAYFATFDNAVHATLILSDGTVTLFDESAKRVACNGNIKTGTYGKTIVLYCYEGKFCNKMFELEE